MTYEALSSFAVTWGLFFLIAMFAIAVVYALWPDNREKFEHASKLPLLNDQENEQ